MKSKMILIKILFVSIGAYWSLLSICYCFTNEQFNALQNLYNAIDSYEESTGNYLGQLTHIKDNIGAAFESKDHINAEVFWQYMWTNECLAGLGQMHTFTYLVVWQTKKYMHSKHEMAPPSFIASLNLLNMIMLKEKEYLIETQKRLTSLAKTVTDTSLLRQINQIVLTIDNELNNQKPVLDTFAGLRKRLRFKSHLKSSDLIMDL